jgi:head-tail adaptor
MSLRAAVTASRLNDRVRPERNHPTRSATGAQIDDWRPLIASGDQKCWAAVDGAKASSPEPLADGGIRTPRDYTVWIRADIYTRYAITPLDRIVWKGRILNIADIPDQGLRGRLIAIIARAGMNQG